MNNGSEGIMKHSKILLVLGIFIAASFLASCNGQAVPPETSGGDQQVQEGQAPDEVTDEKGADAVEDAAASTSAGEMPEGQEAEQPPPQATPRGELEAIDPSTVALASGEPVLLEFFAFW